MARERKVSKTVREDKSGVDFEFADGSTLAANVADLPDDIKDHLIIHGLSQKIGDSYSGEDAENCFTIADTVYKALTEGKWSTRTGGSGGPRISQLAEALSRATGQDVADCVALIADMSDEEKAGLRAADQIKAKIAEIKLEKAQADAEKAKADAGDNDMDLGALFS